MYYLDTLRSDPLKSISLRKFNRLYSVYRENHQLFTTDGDFKAIMENYGKEENGIKKEVDFLTLLDSAALVLPDNGFNISEKLMILYCFCIKANLDLDLSIEKAADILNHCLVKRYIKPNEISTFLTSVCVNYNENIDIFVFNIENNKFYLQQEYTEIYKNNVLQKDIKFAFLCFCTCIFINPLYLKKFSKRLLKNS